MQNGAEGRTWANTAKGHVLRRYLAERYAMRRAIAISGVLAAAARRAMGQSPP
jgi:hypothetical protein